MFGNTDKREEEEDLVGMSNGGEAINHPIREKEGGREGGGNKFGQMDGANR
jgi:hypothetical protein